jgi:predicted nucleic acid-binding protein
VDRFEAVYLDSSIVIRRILNQPDALRPFEWSKGASSELLIVEMWRTLHRLRANGKLNAEQFAAAQAEANQYAASIELIPVSPLVLARASGPFEAPIATLDAIHLSSALLWREHTRKPLLFLTHDRQLATAAVLSGFKVHPWPVP